MSKKEKEKEGGAVAEAQLPTMGRIVIFTDETGKRSPAIVNEITPSGEMHVCVFDSTFGPRNYVVNGEGDQPGQWAWPPRD